EQSQNVPKRPIVNSTNSQSVNNNRSSTSLSMSASPATDNDKYSNVQIDTIKKGNGTDTSHMVTEIEQLYMSQTNNELNTTTEKGPAVFFEMAGGASATVFYAFHNTTPRGTIIKVFNPGNGKTIFVKVLGPLPETKQYYNSIIGITGAAKEALGVNDNKAWCELTFAAQ